MDKNEILLPGTEIVAVSTDSEFSHFAWATTPRKQGGLGDIKIPLLSDKSHRISRAYGVLDEEKGVPFKGLFIADCKQVLRHMAVHDVSIPRSVDEVLRLVNACQYVDKYGDVCPAGLSKNAEKRPQTESKCGAPGKISEYFAVC
ncbi:peroxiredoxin 1 [Orussus abietinus]|uniref:peroxiredoxin 1 n=1 Tax=Orussus abietinus TaxID=222816 RepID=UPI000C715B70|nr:peroxiredoxin 1 [Orussus abietinus]